MALPSDLVGEAGRLFGRKGELENPGVPQTDVDSRFLLQYRGKLLVHIAPPHGQTEEGVLGDALGERRQHAGSSGAGDTGLGTAVQDSHLDFLLGEVASACCADQSTPDDDYVRLGHGSGYRETI